MFGQRPEDFEKVMDAPAPEAVILTPIELDTIFAEYVARAPDLIVHIYRVGEWYWHNADAQSVWEEFVSGFQLQGFENRLLVEFIPEAYGWCVSVKGVAAIKTPKHELVTDIIQKIQERVELRKKGG